MGVFHEDKCPECGSEEFYEDECDNILCNYCGCLFAWCPDCGWTDHEECEE